VHWLLSSPKPPIKSLPQSRLCDNLHNTWRGGVVLSILQRNVFYDVLILVKHLRSAASLLSPHCSLLIVISLLLIALSSSSLSSSLLSLPHHPRVSRPVLSNALRTFIGRFRESLGVKVMKTLRRESDSAIHAAIDTLVTLLCVSFHLRRAALLAVLVVFLTQHASTQMCNACLMEEKTLIAVLVTWS